MSLNMDWEEMDTIHSPKWIQLTIKSITALNFYIVFYAINDLIMVAPSLLRKRKAVVGAVERA